MDTSSTLSTDSTEKVDRLRKRFSQLCKESSITRFTCTSSDVSTDNLKYLSTDQAIEDLAHFIAHQKATIRGMEHSKVVLVGTAYSGTLVTWFRQKHPELCDFAWVSSAPLEAKLDFYEYKEAVGEGIRSVGGQACYDKLDSAFRAMEEHIENGNRAYVSEQFNLCNALSNTLNVWSFFSGVSNAISAIVQFHNGKEIQEFCETFTGSQLEDDVQALASLFNDGSATECVDNTYITFRTQMGESSWTSPAVTSGLRQWYYQACNEFGWYPTSSSEEQPFGTQVPVTLNTQMCNDVFTNQ